MARVFSSLPFPCVSFSFVDALYLDSIACMCGNAACSSGGVLDGCFSRAKLPPTLWHLSRRCWYSAPHPHT